MVRVLTPTIAAVFLSFNLISAQAHHGFRVHYDVDKQIQIEGVLQRAKLQNPHSFLEVLVDNDAGESELWVCETQAKSVMLRKGITATQFVEGQRITIHGSASRRDDNHCEVGTVDFSDGSSIVFRSIQGRANIGNYAKVTVAADDPNAILGTWIRASFKGFPVEGDVDKVITEAGKNANAVYRAATDDPSNFCIAANPVRAFIAPGTPTKISQQGDQLTIQHEFMDAQRKVTLHDEPQQQLGQPPYENYAANNLGYAYGRFEGKFDQKRLIVYSSGFAPGVLLTQHGESGVLHSAKLTMVETFSVNKESGELDYYWQAFDADYFPDGIKGKLSLTKVDMDIARFDCKIEN